MASTNQNPRWHSSKQIWIGSAITFGMNRFRRTPRYMEAANSRRRTRKYDHHREAGDQLMTLDHIIVKVNDLEASVAFYTSVLGFIAEGTDGPFTVLRVGADFQIQLAP